MRIDARADEGNVGCKRNIAGKLLPGELKRIFGRPHVLAAARDGVTPRAVVVFHAPGMKNRTDILVAVEDSNWSRGEKRKREEQQEKRKLACSHLDLRA